ncbi:MAG: M20 aminoacylase family protein [Burkholderiales bacterium]
MAILKRACDLQAEMTAWRHDLHKHPETAFEEVRTSEVVAGKLAQLGFEVHRGLAKTGVVGTLRLGRSERRIGLRADMDALHLQELNDFEHRSLHAGRMHACGHDGHTAMLLGAACMLSERRRFDGIVHLIFQPAEENEAGGLAMIRDGLFELFPVEAVYGMHNIPGIEAGHIHMRAGAQMASADFFRIVLKGKGGHAAFPHTVIDPIPAAAHLVSALQTIVSRELSPFENAVVSVTQMEAGETTNVIPETAMLRGTTRSFSHEAQQTIEQAMRRLVQNVAQSHRLSVEFQYDRRYPPTVNSPAETLNAERAARATVGDARVNAAANALMAAEDFGWMLKEKPGCYVFIGNGTGSRGGCMVHNPNYDFNDEILAAGASYWVHLVEQQLPMEGRGA